MVAGFVVCELAQFLRVTGEGAHRRDPRINVSDQLVITVDYPSRVCERGIGDLELLLRH